MQYSFQKANRRRKWCKISALNSCIGERVVGSKCLANLFVCDWGNILNTHRFNHYLCFPHLMVFPKCIIVEGNIS